MELLHEMLHIFNTEKYLGNYYHHPLLHQNEKWSTGSTRSLVQQFLFLLTVSTAPKPAPNEVKMSKNKKKKLKKKMKRQQVRFNMSCGMFKYLENVQNLMVHVLSEEKRNYYFMEFWIKT